MFRTSRGRSKSMSKSIRAVFDLEDDDNGSQLSVASNLREADYNKLKNQFFQPSGASQADAIKCRDKVKGNDIGSMLSLEYEHTGSSSDSSGRDSDSTEVQTPTDSGDTKVNELDNRFNFIMNNKVNGLYKDNLFDKKNNKEFKMRIDSNNPNFKSHIDLALKESSSYLVLSGDDIHRIRNDLQNLNKRSESLSTRLELETKVRDASLALRKLHSSNKKVMSQAEEQLEAANKKLDQVNRELWEVSNQKWNLKQQLIQHTAAVLAVATKGQINTANMAVVSESFTRNGNEKGLKLEQALDLVKSKDLEIFRLKANNSKIINKESRVSQDDCKCDQLKPLKQELNEKIKELLDTRAQLNDQRETSSLLAQERQQTAELQRQIQHLNRELKVRKAGLSSTSGQNESIKTKLSEAIEEADLLYRRNLETNQQLAQLYHELPDINDVDSEEDRFTLEKFVGKVKGLVGENEELIDQIISLQELNLSLKDRVEALEINLETNKKGQHESNKLTMEEVEEVVFEIQEELDESNAKIVELEHKLSESRANLEIIQNDRAKSEFEWSNKLLTLKTELETKDILCNKYQQILNSI